MKTMTTIRTEEIMRIETILKAHGFMTRFYTYHTRLKCPTTIAVIEHDGTRLYVGTPRVLAAMDEDKLIAHVERVIATYAADSAGALSAEQVKAILKARGYAAWITTAHYGSRVVVQLGRKQRYLGTLRHLAANGGAVLYARLEALKAAQ